MSRGKGKKNRQKRQHPRDHPDSSVNSKTTEGRSSENTPAHSDDLDEVDKYGNASPSAKPKADIQLPLGGTQGSIADEERQEKIRIETHSEHWQAPLPPPNVLKEYNVVHPGASELILDSFIKEGNHRREQQKKIVEAQIEDVQAESRLASRGQFFAFVLGIVAMGLGTFLTIQGHEIVGGGMIGVPILTFAGSFLKTRTSKQSVKQDEVKSQNKENYNQN